MIRYVALLRAVNVGGTGKLAMTELKSMCSDAGFARVETYIASGNVVFDSKAAPAKVKAALEARLLKHFDKPVGVVVRTASQMAAVLAANPFQKAGPKHTYAFFLDGGPRGDSLDKATGRTIEKMVLGDRGIFVHYPDGMGRSKLRIPAARMGTARNMNTVARLVEIASKA